MDVRYMETMKFIVIRGILIFVYFMDKGEPWIKILNGEKSLNGYLTNSNARIQSKHI